jgi:hypothetical protein
MVVTSEGRLTMWTALFVFAVGAAVCFMIAALVLQSSRHANNSVARSIGRSAPSPDSSSSLSAPPALLLQRMRSLRLEPDEFRRADPVVFQELASRCHGCAEQTRCMSDLAEKAADGAGETWREYCPNGAMLNALRTLRDCCTTVSAGAGAMTLA